MVDASAALQAVRLRRFEDVLGQDGLVEPLRQRIDDNGGEFLPHIVFAGREGVGKLSLARLYAQAILCRSRAGGSPCQECDDCNGVMNDSGLNYVELAVRPFEDDQRFRKLVAQTKAGLKTSFWRVFVIHDAEHIDAASADVMLKTLEKELDTVFIFVVNDLAKFPRALVSRCQVFRVAPVEREALVERLKDICVRESLNYEDRALSVIARAAGGRVGEALTKLAEVASGGAVTEANAWRTLNLEWGEAMIKCWEAQLRGRVDEGLSYFKRIASDDAGRVRAMQSFILAVRFRNTDGALPLGISPALDCVADEAWLSILEGWKELSRRRSVSVDLLVEEAMKFWGTVSQQAPARAAFHKGYERLAGVEYGNEAEIVAT